MQDTSIINLFKSFPTFLNSTHVGFLSDKDPKVNLEIALLEEALATACRAKDIFDRKISKKLMKRRSSTDKKESQVSIEQSKKTSTIKPGMPAKEITKKGKGSLPAGKDSSSSRCGSGATMKKPVPGEAKNLKMDDRGKNTKRKLGPEIVSGGGKKKKKVSPAAFTADESSPIPTKRQKTARKFLHSDSEEEENNYVFRKPDSPGNTSPKTVVEKKMSKANTIANRMKKIRSTAETPTKEQPKLAVSATSAKKTQAKDKSPPKRLEVAAKAKSPDTSKTTEIAKKNIADRFDKLRSKISDGPAKKAAKQTAKKKQSYPTIEQQNEVVDNSLKNKKTDFIVPKKPQAKQNKGLPKGGELSPYSVSAALSNTIAGPPNAQNSRLPSPCFKTPPLISPSPTREIHHQEKTDFIIPKRPQDGKGGESSPYSGYSPLTHSIPGPPLPSSPSFKSPPLVTPSPSRDFHHHQEILTPVSTAPSPEFTQLASLSYGDATEAMDIEDDVSFGDVAPASHEEGMDWEVNELRKGLKDHFDASSFKHTADSSWTGTDQNPWLIVVDTNVYISALSFVQMLLETDVPGKGYPVIYVPHRVLCELDSIKDGANARMEVGTSARMAANFLNKKFSEKHPRVRGQSLDHYISLGLSPDDKILKSCMQIQRLHIHDKQVILLSNDTNLRTKALVQGLETFCVADFERVVLNLTNDCPIDQLPLSQLNFRVESLLQIAFEQIWSVECRGRRPRYLRDYVESFAKPWFAKRLTDNAEEALYVLRESLPDGKSSLIKTVSRGISFLSHFRIISKPYYSLLKKALQNLDKLHERIKDAAYPSPEPLLDDKNHIGLLETQFVACNEAIQAQITKINNARANGDCTDHTLKEIEEFLKVATASLAEILHTPILQMNTCNGLSALAYRLASVSEPTQKSYQSSLQKIAVTVQGRDFLDTALAVFKDSLECIQNSWHR